MKKIFIYVFITFLTSSLYAEDSKPAMTKDEFMKKIMQLENRKKKAISKTKAMKEETKKLKKLNKTLDELNDMLKVKK